QVVTYDSLRYYQSTADVTGVVQDHGPGAYRLSGVDMRDPANLNNEVLYAAWSMVVFYTLDGLEPRNLTIFDGLDLVTSGVPASGTVEGFLVPNAGYDGRLGVIAYEGDGSISGDTLNFNGVPLTDGVNPTNNFFNSSRSHLGSAVTLAGDLPQATGGAQSMSGLDLDVVSVTPMLSPGDRSATFSASSTQDTYLIGAFVTSIATFKPVFTRTSKSVEDLNGGVVAPGDVLRYTVTTENTGTDSSAETVLTDPLPAGVTYVPGSMQILEGAHPGPKTDAVGDDQADYDPATRTLVFRLGTGAGASQGGAIPVGGRATVAFLVTVDADAWGEIANQAILTAAGQVGLSQGVGPVSFPSDPAGTGERRQPVVQVKHETFIEEAPPAITPDREASFRFRTSLPVAPVECRRDARALTPCAAQTSFNVGEGSHLLEVRYVDGDGGRDPSPASHAWVVDLTAPETTLTQVPASMVATST